VPVTDEPGPDYFDLCSMIYTSGTTGPSKGVLVPWALLFEFVRIQPPDFLPPGGAYYAMFPAFHVSGKASLYIAARAHGHVVLRRRSACPSSGTTSAPTTSRRRGSWGPWRVC
jgi:crotonobetaine/carnitine-CoA ligase